MKRGFDPEVNLAGLTTDQLHAFIVGATAAYLQKSVEVLFRLPEEILLHIFLLASTPPMCIRPNQQLVSATGLESKAFAAPIQNKSIFQIVLVCKLWRTILLNFPSQYYSLLWRLRFDENLCGRLNTRDCVFMRDNLLKFRKSAVVIEARWPRGDFLAKKRESSQYFPTFCVNNGVLSGKYYYEVVLHATALYQIGWVTAQSVPQCVPGMGYGVGDDDYSWAYDGLRQKKWGRSLQQRREAEEKVRAEYERNRMARGGRRERSPQPPEQVLPILQRRGHLVRQQQAPMHAAPLNRPQRDGGPAPSVQQPQPLLPNANRQRTRDKRGGEEGQDRDTIGKNEKEKSDGDATEKLEPKEEAKKKENATIEIDDDESDEEKSPKNTQNRDARDKARVERNVRPANRPAPPLVRAGMPPQPPIGLNIVRPPLVVPPMAGLPPQQQQQLAQTLFQLVQPQIMQQNVGLGGLPMPIRFVAQMPRDNAENGAAYGEKWEEGNVVGCCLDADEGFISWSLNGVDLGVAFEVGDLSEGLGPYYPAVSIGNTVPDVSCLFVFDASELQYKPPGYSALPGCDQCQMCVIKRDPAVPYSRPILAGNIRIQPIIANNAPINNNNNNAAVNHAAIVANNNNAAININNNNNAAINNNPNNNNARNIATPAQAEWREDDFRRDRPVSLGARDFDERQIGHDSEDADGSLDDILCEFDSDETITISSDDNGMDGDGDTSQGEM